MDVSDNSQNNQTRTTNVENLEKEHKKFETSQLKDEKTDENDAYQKTKTMLLETKKNSQNALDSLSATLEKLNASLKGAYETTNAIDKFKEDFGKNLNQLVERIADSFSGSIGAPHRRRPGEGEEHMIPKVSNVNAVLEEIATKSHIVVLTGENYLMDIGNCAIGAGISVASNIITFRDEGGFWTLRDKKDKIKTSNFLTHKFFLQSPEEIWRWHHEFKKMVVKNAPNNAHYALANLQLFCKQNELKFTLVTQNIDNFHIQANEKAGAKISEPTIKSPANNQKKPLDKNRSTPQVKALPKQSFEENKIESPKKPITQEQKRFGFCNDVYEIHGNINYMRCDSECTTELFPSPEVGCDDNFVPKCPKCQGIARPHTLLFDETYKEEYYRGTSLTHELESMDCLIVTGTTLETSFAARMVRKAIDKNILIVEINPLPCIEYGNVRRLIGGSEQHIPKLCEGFMKVKAPKEVIEVTEPKKNVEPNKVAQNVKPAQPKTQIQNKISEPAKAGQNLKFMEAKKVVQTKKVVDVKKTNK